jgi:hypothetical protein
MRRKYSVVVDVETTFITDVVADSLSEAKDKAIEYAYQDTFGCKSVWTGTGEVSGALVDCWNDMSDEELLASIKQITGAEHPNHLMNHIIKAEKVYQHNKEL